MRRNGRKRLGAVVALLVVLSLSGCWPQFGYGPEHRHWNPHEARLTAANAASLRQSWAEDFADVAETNGWGLSVGSPIVDGGRVVVTSQEVNANAHVTAFDVATGVAAWDTVLDPAGPAPTTVSAPVIVDGKVQVSWTGPIVPPSQCPAVETRLDPATGAVVTQAQTNPLRPIPSVPSVVSGDRYVQFAWVYPAGRCDRIDDVVYAVRDAPSGATPWYAGGDLQQASAMVAGGRIFAGEPQRVVAWDLDGCGAAICPPDWTVHVGQFLINLTEAGGRLFGVTGGEVVAVDIAGRRVAWRGETGVPAGVLASADGFVFLATEGALQAFDADGCGEPTCHPVWSATLPDPAQQISLDIAVAGGVVYVGRGSFDPFSPVGHVLAFPAAGCEAPTCAPLWSSPERTGRVESVVVADGTLVTTVNDTRGLPDRLVTYTPT